MTIASMVGTTPTSTRQRPSARMPCLVMDHPAWLRGHTVARRAFRSPTGSWMVTCNQRGTPQPRVSPLGPGNTGAHSAEIDWFDVESLPPLLQAAKPFRYFKRVARVRNPDLWDALLLRIMRSSDPYPRTRSLYRLLCLNHGSLFQTPVGITIMSPTPERILTVSPTTFGQMRLEQKGTLLRETAEEYRRRQSEFVGLPPPALAEQLQSLPHVSSWTARSAVADTTNEFSLIRLPEITAHGRSASLLTPQTCSLTVEQINDLALSPAQRSTFVALVLALHETLNKRGVTPWKTVTSLDLDVN